MLKKKKKTRSECFTSVHGVINTITRYRSFRHSDYVYKFAPDTRARGHCTRLARHSCIFEQWAPWSTHPAILLGFKINNHIKQNKLWTAADNPNADKLKREYSIKLLETLKIPFPTNFRPSYRAPPSIKKHSITKRCPGASGGVNKALEEIVLVFATKQSGKK